MVLYVLALAPLEIPGTVGNLVAKSRKSGRLQAVRTRARQVFARD
jgi:hypothetical protein